VGALIPPAGEAGGGLKLTELPEVTVTLPGEELENGEALPGPVLSPAVETLNDRICGARF
jgi:hypothetical protein